MRSHLDVAVRRPTKPRTTHPGCAFVRLHKSSGGYRCFFRLRKKLQKAIEAIKCDYSDRNKENLVEGTYYADVIGTVSRFLGMEEKVRQAVIRELNDMFPETKKSGLEELLEESLPPATYEMIQDIHV